jgi:flagellum-specific peptidoglycan hydrolase FlgJ
MTRQDYVKKYYPLARQVTTDTGIFPETLLIIGIVESAGKDSTGRFIPGNSFLAKNAFNHFGIKKYPAWRGATVKLNTPGDANKQSEFVKFANDTDGFRGFVDFLQRNPRYNTAGVFTATDYVTQLARIASAGYAENPEYLTLLRSISTLIQPTIEDLKKNFAARRATFTVMLALTLTAIFVLSKR